ncbi:MULTISPECIES: hypothetical protein [Sphingomonas]|uniref:Uncharacterized protein n=1 Tax=Sphingomonas zeae TaxID=1646122 RepID=A0A7Y6B2C3_9SPHN|nr:MULTISPECIES: hypothetical protein [Sphingomonas]MBB4049626.1 hypothetical protein [Sphingomonas zeae]MDK8188001.1 hypothetical protein [Sphingomonas zeae]MDK8217931.1 hypothetical protein [Sphingomonas sp. UMB7805-LC452B]NUU46008.1 hypothetical protein [Sphingomonas zeae]
MSIALPLSPSPSSSTPSYLDYGGTLRPIFGGAMQKLTRLGDRFAIEVTLPPLPYAETGMLWIARLIRAQRDGAIFPWPQPDFDTGAPGSPVVNGSGQSGSAINLRGLANGYTVKEGQFFSIIHGGRRYLEQAAATATVANGQLSLPITPMLRISPQNGAVVEIAKPMIEGLLDGDARSWSVDLARTVGLTFTITEMK